MYRCVVCSVECPAKSWTSLSDPPTVEILRAAFVMNVRLPLCEEHPWNPRSRYQPWNIFTIVCALTRFDRSLVITNSEIVPTWILASNNSLNSNYRCLFSGIILPDLPFDALSVRWIASPTNPSAVKIIDHFKWAISLARSPAFTDNIRMTWFLNPFRRAPRYCAIASTWFFDNIFACFPKLISVSISVWFVIKPLYYNDLSTKMDLCRETIKQFQVVGVSDYILIGIYRV